MFNLRRLVLALIVSSLSAACGSSDRGSSSGSAATPNETISTSEEIADWRSVHYTWISNWTPCRDNKVEIKRSRQIMSVNCEISKTAVLTLEDFRVVEQLIRPVFKSFNATLDCADEAIMDWSVYTYLTVGSKTKKMYSFDAEQNCARGDRAAVEQLQETLEALNNKYFPRELLLRRIN